MAKNSIKLRVVREAEYYYPQMWVNGKWEFWWFESNRVGYLDQHTAMEYAIAYTRDLKEKAFKPESQVVWNGEI